MDAKGGHSRVPIKRADGKGRHYDVEMKGWMEKVALWMCNLKRRVDK